MKEHKEEKYIKQQSSFSLRWGSTGDEATLYFDTEEELQHKLEVITTAIKKAVALKQSVNGGITK